MFVLTLSVFDFIVYQSVRQNRQKKRKSCRKMYVCCGQLLVGERAELNLPVDSVEVLEAMSFTSRRLEDSMTCPWPWP